MSDIKSVYIAIIRVSAHWSEIHALKMHILIVLLLMNQIWYETKGGWQKMRLEGKQIGRYHFKQLIGRGRNASGVRPALLQI